MKDDVVSLNYLSYDLDRAMRKAGTNQGGAIMFHLLEMHDRPVPDDVLTVLNNAKERALTQAERGELKRLTDLHDLSLDVHLAETESLPQEPFEFMLTGVTRDFLRNLNFESFKTGKAMATILLETQKKEEICPKALELLEKNPGTFTKSGIAGFIWLQMAYDYRRAVGIVKAFEKVS